MAHSINNQTTNDNYTPACTLEDVGAGRVSNLQISGNAVLMQLKLEYARGDRRWDTESYQLPVVGGLGRTRVCGIRFRSATTGLPAQVSATIS